MLQLSLNSFVVLKSNNILAGRIVFYKITYLAVILAKHKTTNQTL